MADREHDPIGELAVACTLQAAIVAARQEGADRVVLALEDVLAGLQPGFLVAA
jgi:hypothetical protein